MIVLIFKKSTFSIIQMSITSNLEQSVSLVYFIGALNIEKKAIETGCETSTRNSLTIHLSNYWWAGINKCVYSTILVTTQFYFFMLL